MDDHREFQLLPDSPDDQDALDEQPVSTVHFTPSSGKGDPKLLWEFQCIALALSIFTISLVIFGVIDLRRRISLACFLFGLPQFIAAQLVATAAPYYLGLRFPHTSPHCRLAITVVIALVSSITIGGTCNLMLRKMLDNGVCP